MSKMPVAGDSIEWTTIRMGTVHHHSGVLISYFERSKKMFAEIMSSGRRSIVPAGRIKLSSRVHNVKGKLIQMQKTGSAH